MSKLKIPKTIIQTSIEKQPRYVAEMIMSHCTGWEYIHFNDDQIIRFFKENLIEEFSDIIEKYHSFSNGAHRADLFRYYYLVSERKPRFLVFPMENFLGFCAG